MINHEVKVLTENEEQSRNVQEILFKHGIKWVYHDDTVVRNTNSAGLIVQNNWERPGEMAIYVSSPIKGNDKSFASYDDFMKQYGKIPRKHAELIKAWADGAEIQYFSNPDWLDVDMPQWLENCEYRIKPAESEKEETVKVMIYSNKGHLISITESTLSDAQEFMNKHSNNIL